jgi:hypothetical protein
MAITLASDIVVDVLNAGDPASVRAAADRLLRMQKAGGPDPAAETAAPSRVGFEVAAPSAIRPGLDTVAVSRPTADRDVAGSAYRKFEAFVLQTFMESMLPRNEQIFGKGTAGNVWRSMLAEQLGTQLSKSGGIGIAHLLAKSQPSAGDDPNDDKQIQATTGRS